VRLIDRYFAHDAAFQSCEATLLRALHRDQVEAGMIRGLKVLNADGHAESGFEIMTCVNLFQRHCIRRFR